MRASDLYSIFKPSPLGRPEVGPYHSAEGFFGLAGSYLKAADVTNVQGPALTTPALSCLGQAIELLLKAYLLATGVGEKELSRVPYSHDLLVCFQEAERRGLYGRFSETESQEFSKFSQLYATKELHYLYEYTKSMPDFFVVREIANRIQEYVFVCLSKPYFDARKAD